ncbi:hypothetical protein K470DRAFT_108839 [Piedraia hortae CBS 480.64]|uniref:Uncharacterized protein n=1 Tax=Piedraia hortae CBS 480.64 TaxID=1314780 RepID=A0A6A7BVT5_9PEZI|nr:hypothetical protein K470DRAFT_108839 [Piedraia hortae CBS 480.64]
MGTIDREDQPLLHAIVALCKALQRKPDTAQLTIELIDQRVIDGLFIFPFARGSITPYSDINVYETIVEIVVKHGEDWDDLKLVRRGLVPNEAKYSETIVITTPTADADNCLLKIQPEIRLRFNAVGPRGCESLVYGSSVFMGASIGQCDIPNHWGTAGGMFVLENGQECILTNPPRNN